MIILKTQTFNCWREIECGRCFSLCRLHLEGSSKLLLCPIPAQGTNKLLMSFHRQDYKIITRAHSVYYSYAELKILPKSNSNKLNIWKTYNFFLSNFGLCKGIWEVTQPAYFNKSNCNSDLSSTYSIRLTIQILQIVAHKGSLLYPQHNAAPFKSIPFASYTWNVHINKTQSLMVHRFLWRYLWTL